ncbi:165_t:CDS:2 [Entrophospora sp. SA101]|nr:165_t:CDS:2 [Entrophospora sp. SA101]
MSSSISPSTNRNNNNNTNTRSSVTYESFPDPDPEDFVNVYSWDLPDSISATEDAGGVLQMIEYDGMLINGIRVN